MMSKRRNLAIILALLVLAAILFLVWQVLHSRSALWRIVSTSCIPATLSGGTGRCAEVSLAKGVESGFVVFKDRHGPLQYLLMPTRRVTGIEDPFLLSADSPPYWAQAWRAKRWMEVSNGRSIPRDAVSITVNSAWGRSQNQLHLHVSCVRADLRSFLQSVPTIDSEIWTSIRGGWMGHPYEARKLVAETLDGQDLFKDVAKDHAGDMGRQAIAVIATQFNGHDGFWLLRTQTDLSAMWFGSIEGDVQDHTCSVLHRTSGP
jgi:CDP-diacylglycerol pyrophosphatase